MRLLAYGDLQINFHRSDYMNYLAQTLSALCTEIRNRRPSIVVNLGDTFDTFGVIGARELVFAKEWMTRVESAMGPNGTHIVLLGNHDVGGPGVSAIEVFESTVTHVVMRPQRVVIDGTRIGLLPYDKDIENVRAALPGLGPLDIAFGHVDWIGPRLTPTCSSESGLDPSEWEKLYPGVIVMNGHYHTPQYRPPIYCVGAPLFMDFSDANSEIARGFALWEDGKLAQIPNPHTFRLARIETDSESELRTKLEKLGKETKVRVACPRHLIPVVEEYREKLLWCRVSPSDTLVARRMESMDIKLTSSAQEAIDEAIRDVQGFEMERLRAVGQEVFGL